MRKISFSCKAAAVAVLSLLASTPLKAQTVVLNKVSDRPFYYSVAVPDGNYKVTVTLGARRRAARTVVRAESRRLFVEEVATKKGKYATRTFIVNKRSPRIDDRTVVKIKEREKDYLNWDDSLTLEFNGAAPAVRSISIEPDTTALTVFLCGNSTVVDQNNEPWASWGQMIPRWFDERVAISNHAESGLTARTFLASNRLDKILSMMKAGDYVFCEFGHNDEKEHRPGDGAWYHYVYNLAATLSFSHQPPAAVSTTPSSAWCPPMVTSPLPCAWWQSASKCPSSTSTK